MGGQVVRTGTRDLHAGPWANLNFNRVPSCLRNSVIIPQRHSQTSTGTQLFSYLTASSRPVFRGLPRDETFARDLSSPNLSFSSCHLSPGDRFWLRGGTWLSALGKEGRLEAGILPFPKPRSVTRGTGTTELPSVNPLCVLSLCPVLCSGRLCTEGSSQFSPHGRKECVDVVRCGDMDLKLTDPVAALSPAGAQCGLCL